MMMATYLIVTVSMIAQKMSDSTPSTCGSSGTSGCAPWNDSFIAYSGEVPISPKTTPMALSARAAALFCLGVVVSTMLA